MTLAVIVVLPAATPFTVPLLTVAMLLLPEDQETVAPAGKLLTDSVSLDPLTVRVSEVLFKDILLADTETVQVEEYSWPSTVMLAVILVLPTAFAVTLPLLSTEATPLLSLDQVTL